MKKLLIILLMFIFTTDSFASGIASNSASALCDNDTLSKYSGTANVEINWEPNTIGLKWYNGEEQISGQTSCVYDGTITVPPTPTKPGYTFNGWKVIKVPGGYTELEYLQTDGNQFIDTELTGKTRWLGKAQSTQNTQKSQTVLIGTYVGVCSSYVGSVANGNIWTTCGNDPFDTQYAITSAQEFDLMFDDSGVTGTIGTVNINHTGRNITFDMSWKICCNTSMFPYIGKLFWFKAYQNNIMVRNFIPARRNSDNVLGMWDTVSQTFFTNAGKGSFTAGPVVQ